MTRACARLVLESAEAFVALLCVLAGAGYLAGAPQPGSIDAVLPAWIRTGWGGYLLAGGILVLAGVAAGRRRTEKVGLWLLAGPGVAYAAAAIAYGRAPALFPAGLTIAFAAAFAVRAMDGLQAWARLTLGTAPPRPGEHRLR